MTAVATFISLTEQSNSNLTPFGALYDSLARPSFSNDQQVENETNNNSFSSLLWRHIPNNIVPHIVLGDTSIGGSWTGFEDEVFLKRKKLK